MSLFAAGIAAALGASILALVAVKTVPSLRVLALYGKTGQRRPRSASACVEMVAQWTVPKQWFVHFYYVLAVALLVKPRWSDTAWQLLMLQAARRACECHCAPDSSARMNVLHYVAGMVFYTTIAANTATRPCRAGRHPWLVALFVAASLDQLGNHRHLARLAKYTEPTRGLFRWLATPHYLDEIAIYLAVAMCGSTSFWYALNYWLSVAFVATNLTISSLESHKFYQRCGRPKRWAIFPGVL